MSKELFLRRKWTLRAHGEQVVFVKKRLESTEHVLMKALLWALYLPLYPDVRVEVGIGDRYKPDLVSLDRWQRPRFWGEAGEVGAQKIESLSRRYRRTHFAMAKWDAQLTPFVDLVGEALQDLSRSAPFDLLAFPADSAERYVDERGEITIRFDDLDWVRLGADTRRHP
jgi:hypothetical protein